ncbi:MAG: tetratricopeptide repeat protein [Myxococcales bacterium]|nr:tetratricopeptide repeat protein [Myxococcales bacterium]
MSEEEHRPTVLLVGQGEPMQTALGEALRRHGVSVAASATAELENAVRVYAPDLVVLIGDAAVRGGASVVQRMAANRATDVLPIAVVSNEAVLKHEGPDFRNGAVAIVPRGAGADTIARRLTELAQEVPDRSGLASGELNEDNLRDVVSLVSSDHKTGILSIQSPKGVLEGMPIVIETESPSAHNMELILERLREAVAESEPLEYEFHEASGGRLSTLPAAIEPTDAIDLSVLEGSRMVILDTDELRAEKLAHALHAKGVQVAAADFSTAVIPRIREVDPQVVVMDSIAVGGKGIEFVRAIRKDPQLRWASMLVVRWDDFWPSAVSDAEPDLPRLVARITPLIEQDAVVARRVTDEVDFDTRLELIGPGRLLRALGSVPGVRHVAIVGNKRNVEVDIADNSIVGAYATLREGTTLTLQGIPALTALWGMNSGRVSIREQDLPSVANIMMPVDEALGVVARELGVAEGENAVIGDAPTAPPAAPEAQDHVTMPPSALPRDGFEQLRTMAPPRFRHLQTADAEGQAIFEDEAPTNKRAQLVGKIETQRRAFAASAAVHESNGPERHTDHGAPRLPKKTQMGLAPVFEMLPEDTEKTIPVPKKPAPTPPPPPASERSSRGPLFADQAFDHELASMLEGATILAPSSAHSTPVWLPILLLVALLGGGGFLAWQLWLADSDSVAAAEVEKEAPADQSPITGPVDGLEALDEGLAAEMRSADEEVAETQADEASPEEPVEEETVEPEAARSVQEAPPTPKQPTQPEEPAASETPTQLEDPPTPQKPKPVIPTQNLPREPDKASDVLVHRALALIRGGELDRAGATLDRAWELDPKNPQAMAGYATLYVAAKDGERAAKWAERAVAKRPRRAQYKVLLGDALMLQGKVIRAREAWRKALVQDPDNRAARARLARTEARAAD